MAGNNREWMAVYAIEMRETDLDALMTTTESIAPARRTRGMRFGVPRPGVGELRLHPTRRGRGFIVGLVDAAGPDTNGFAPRDRVAWRDRGGDLGELLLIQQDDVLGVPDWISDEQVVSYLAPGLVARALLHSQPVGRGERVRIESADSVVSAMTAAWVRSLGARVDDRAAATIHDVPQARRTVLGSHGRLAQAAVEVFQAIRSGVFDDVDLVPGHAINLAA